MEDGDDDGDDVMMVVAMVSLKAEMAASRELAQESTKFVMVNAEDDEEPHNEAVYNVDGGYGAYSSFQLLDKTQVLTSGGV